MSCARHSALKKYKNIFSKQDVQCFFCVSFKLPALNYRSGSTLSIHYQLSQSIGFSKQSIPIKRLMRLFYPPLYRRGWPVGWALDSNVHTRTRWLQWKRGLAEAAEGQSCAQCDQTTSRFLSDFIHIYCMTIHNKHHVWIFYAYFSTWMAKICGNKREQIHTDIVQLVDPTSLSKFLENGSLRALP